MNSKSSKISVCMATFNGEQYIQTQLASILPQLGPMDEVIISDDSSTDSTLSIVRSFNDQRIVILENQKFGSPIFNFENALKHATGEFVLLSDQDDVWLNGKVERILLSLQHSDIVFSDCKIIDSKGTVIEESFFKVNNSGLGFFKNLWKNSYLGCCLAMRRSVLDKALPFPKNIPMHDWWIGMVSEAFFKLAIINQPLISYRRHGVNATPTGEKSTFNYFQRFLFRYALLKGLAKAWLRS